jgi:hypothetical protein
MHEKKSGYNNSFFHSIQSVADFLALFLPQKFKTMVVKLHIWCQKWQKLSLIPSPILKISGTATVIYKQFNYYIHLNVVFTVANIDHYLKFYF